MERQPFTWRDNPLHGKAVFIKAAVVVTCGLVIAGGAHRSSRGKDCWL